MIGGVNEKGVFDLTHVKAVLFDFDGTIMDTNELISDSWRYTVGELTGRQISDDEIRLTLGEILSDSMHRLMPDVDTERALDLYRNYQRDIFLDRITLFDGSLDVLRMLRAAGYKTALVTSRLKGSTERGLAHFGLDSLFDAVLTASDTDTFKPDPAPINIILDKIGCGPKEAIYVGDTKHDIEAGLAAGVFTVLVDWSLALPPDKREDCPAPDAVIVKMRDILDLLGVKPVNMEE